MNLPDGLRLAVVQEPVLPFRYFLLVASALVLAYFILHPVLVWMMKYAEDSVYVSVPFFIFYALPTAIFVYYSGIPLKSFGFSTNHLKTATKTSVACAAVVIVVATLFQWWVADREMGVIGALVEQRPRPLNSFLLLAVYLVFVPVQEFVIRGALLGGILYYLDGRYAAPAGILLSATIYSLVHLYLGFYISVLVFFPGLIWGWLFYKTRSLVAVSFAHGLSGLYVLVCLDLFR